MDPREVDKTYVNGGNIEWHSVGVMWPPQDGTRLLLCLVDGGRCWCGGISEDGDWQYDRHPEMLGRTPKWWAYAPRGPIKKQTC